MTKIIGYARVSSADQDFDLQVKRLKAAGCTGVFAEKASGKSTNGRHQLDKALRTLQPGDILMTVRLDRLARSIRDLLHLLDRRRGSLQGAGRSVVRHHYTAGRVDFDRDGRLGRVRAQADPSALR